MLTRPGFLRIITQWMVRNFRIFSDHPSPPQNKKFCDSRCACAGRKIIAENTRLGSAVRKTMRHTKKLHCREDRARSALIRQTEGEAMREETAREQGAACRDGQPQEMAYGCVFCMTGKEQSVAEQIQTRCPNVRATAMRQLKYQTCRKEPERFCCRATVFLKPLLRWNRRPSSRCRT